MPPRAANSGRYATMPTGTEVASYRTYEEAAAAVDTLIAADFPAVSVDIVGSDLHMVESVLGKLTPARVAASGAGRGLTWGLLMALMTMLMFQELPPIIPMMAIVFGVLGGIVITIIFWAASRNTRSFSARAQLVAGRYAILVSEQTDQAFRLLQGSAGNLVQRPRKRVRTKSVPDGPTEFGSRPDERPKFGVRRSDQGRQVSDEAVSGADEAWKPGEAASESDQGAKD